MLKSDTNTLSKQNKRKKKADWAPRELDLLVGLR